MAVTYRTPGTVTPVVYFENYRGVIALPPSTADALRIKDVMERKGFRLLEADNLRSIRRLAQKLHEQEERQRQGRTAKEEAIFSEDRRKRRERLVNRRNSAECSPFERDFIDEWLKKQDMKEEERKKLEGKITSYFESMEFDHSNHITDLADSSPDSRDTACTKCGNYRRVKGSTLCAVCGGL